MEEQDKLWQEEKENLNTMEKLYNQIIAEAKNKGFKGVSEIYDGENEKCIDIFENQEQKELCKQGSLMAEWETFGYCKPLITYLEKIINF